LHDADRAVSIYMIFPLQFSVQAFPYIDNNPDVFTQIISALLPLFTVISFVIMCQTILKRVVEEKETGVKVCV
jgi:ATP-binding cassette subfamily A (ABC1) protein 3